MYHRTIAVMFGVLFLSCQDAGHPPQIASLTATPQAVDPGGNCVLRVEAADPDGDDITFEWNATSGMLAAAAGDSAIWTAPHTEGAYAVVVTASDGRNSDAASVEIAVGQVPRYLVWGFSHYAEDWVALRQGSYVELVSDPVVRTASVSVEGRALREERTPSLPLRVFADTILPTPGTQQGLEVRTDLGNCAATSMVPGGFGLTAPTGDTIPVGTTLILSWTTASRADWYCVYLWYLWIDTTFHIRETTFVVAETNAAIAGSWLDKSGWLDVSVIAANGPSPDPAASAPGNIVGDAKGYWLGLNGLAKALTVGDGSAALARPERDSPIAALDALRRLYVETLGLQAARERAEKPSP